MRADDENIEIRKLTLHVNDRPINVLAPVKVPKPKYSATRAIHEHAQRLQQNTSVTKREREEAKVREERQRLAEIGQFYEGAKLK